MSEVAVRKPKPVIAPPKIIAPAPPTIERMTLANVVRGKLAKPIRVLIYGIEGVGKSSFAACAPSPIFLGAEDGTSELDVARFPEPHSWNDAMAAVAELTNREHDYRTLVIDTLDWLEPHCWAHTCFGKKDKAGKKIEHVEDFGFNKGYAKALEHWRQLAVALERLRNTRGMHVVLVAHSQIKSFKNPAGEDYERYELKLDKKAGGLLREWSDATLFATHETYTHESNGRAKGISTGARIVHTERTAAWDAKNRYDLPDKLPLDWDAFFEAVQAHRPADPQVLRARIAELLERADDAIKPKVQRAVQLAGADAAELARIANKLAARVGDDEPEPQEHDAETGP